MSKLYKPTIFLLQGIFSWGWIQNWLKMNIVVILLLSALTYTAANGLYIAEFESLYPVAISLHFRFTIWYKKSLP